MDKGKTYPRPHGVPVKIPLWAWSRYFLHRGAVTTRIKPIPPPHPFRGIGAFTERPSAISVFTGLLDYVVLRATQVTPGNVALIHSLGMKCYVWDEPPVNGPISYTDGYVAVVEGPTQLIEAQRWTGGLIAWCVNDTVKVFPPNTYCLAEAYTSDNFHATPDQVCRDFLGRGTNTVCPGVLLGNWTLQQYWPALQLALSQGAPGWWIFSLEAMRPEDIAFLRAIRA